MEEQINMNDVINMNERLIFPYKSNNEQQLYYETLHMIYSRLADETSREIFRCRLMMTMTGDITQVRKLVLKTEAGIKLNDFLKKQSKIYIYGAGIRGQRIYKMFPEMKWEKYIDCKRTGTCNGLKVIKLEEFRCEEEAIVLISNLEGYEEIREDLLMHGISKDRIYILDNFEVIAHRNQYFEERCLSFFNKKKGAFLDAGSFDGADCIRFANSDLYNNNPIYAFEPDAKNYDNCVKQLEKLSNAKALNIGLADDSKQVRFLADKGECSRITEIGGNIIDIDTIDSIVGQEKVGYIKMDIEGNEQQAIRGAAVCIKRDKPNLMISVYHKLDDIIEIPRMLLKLNPDYQFCLGHYSICNADTVLYVF